MLTSGIVKIPTGKTGATSAFRLVANAWNIATRAWAMLVDAKAGGPITSPTA
jgi:hypothetical protein